MLNVLNVQAIDDLLLQIPNIIEKYHQRDLEFIVSTKDWLSQIEKVLAGNRLPVAAEVSILLGTLINVERGLIPTGFAFRHRTSGRKSVEAFAVDVLRKTNEAVAQAILPTVTQIADGRKLARQMLALADKKGLLGQAKNRSSETARLETAWKTIYEDPELGPVAAHLVGLVGLHDAKILLDQMWADNV